MLIGLFLFMDTAYASTWHIRCPDPILEGKSTTAEAYWHNRPEWERVRVWWHTSPISAEEDVDYRAADNERQTASAHERRVAHMRRGVTTYEDTLIEGDETFEFYYIESGGGQNRKSCTITITDNDPGVTDVGVVSSPADGRAYRVGERIEVDLTFSSEVRVVGNPALRLHIGDNTVKARYASGSGTNVLRFAYQVQAGDNDDNGVSIPSIGPAGLRARTIKSAQPDHLDVDAFHNFDDDTSAHVGANLPLHRISTGGPRVTGVAFASSPIDGAAYREGEDVEINVTFNGKVKTEGDPVLLLRLNNAGSGGNDPDNWREASYDGGSTTATLRFSYEIQPGDVDTDGLAIRSNGLRGGKIRAAHVPVDAERGSLNGRDLVNRSLPEHRVDWSGESIARPDVDTGVEAPAVILVKIVSNPGSDETYRNADSVRVRVDFSEDVTVRGRPKLRLDFDGADKWANPYEWGPGAVVPPDSVYFEYQVRVGDTDADGIAIGANSLRLNGGSIRDADGNAADLTHDAILFHPGRRVDHHGGL